jgi:hypothetical protein
LSTRAAFASAAPNGTLLRAARSIRKLERVIAKLEQTMPGEVAQVEKALAVDVAWEFSADVTERLRRFRAIGPDDDGPAPPLTIGTHLDSTDVHIRVPNARVPAIASQLEEHLKALAELIVPAAPAPEVEPDDAKLPPPHGVVRVWTLLYEDDDGERHRLGRIRHRGPKSEATTRLMELYWDDRFDGVGCSPVVLEASHDEDEVGHEEVVAEVG